MTAKLAQAGLAPSDADADMLSTLRGKGDCARPPAILRTLASLISEKLNS
jgi:hypothetical protein